MLLDTHAAVRLAFGDPLTPVALKILAETRREGGDILVSPITAWEVAILTSKRRLTLHMDPIAWFRALLALPGLRLADMPPEVLIASTQLPGEAKPKDPADRIILATARAYGLRLITRDTEMLAYAKEGLVDAIAC